MSVTKQQTAVLARRGALFLLVCAISLVLWIGVLVVLIGQFRGPGD